MKKRPSLSLRELLIAVCLLAACIPLLCFLSFKKAQHSFHQFCQSLYEQEMTSNTLSLHYSLADPAAFGISDYPVTLPAYVPGSELEKSEGLSGLLEDLRHLNRTWLSKGESYALDCLERELSVLLETSRFPYYSDLLSPSSGVQGQLPILLCEYEFRSRRDVEEYLGLLSQTGALYSSLLTYEQEKIASGALPSLSALQKTEKQCDDIVSFESLSAGDHFLQTSFHRRLLALAKSETVTESEILSWEKENDRLLREVFLPAGQALKKGLHSLEPHAARETTGLAALPRGKEYYACLLAKETGSGKTPEEVRTLLEERLVQECEAISNLSKAYPEALGALREGSYMDLGFTDPHDVLACLQEGMQDDFPGLSAFGAFQNDSFPAVTLRTVSPNLQDFAAPAFYLTAPMDDTTHNVIYLNPKSGFTGLELFTTLAHEGFPGHLWQNAVTAANLLSLESGDESRLRQLIGCGGYLEGWAVYAEQRAYDQAALLLSKQGRKNDAVCAIIEKHDKSLQLCLYSLMDVKIHYEGASPADVAKLLEPFGVKEEATIRSVYEYVCQAPCNYLKYYLGYLEILELRKDAKTLWGESYSDRLFHQFLLKWGPADFVSLRAIL